VTTLLRPPAPVHSNPGPGPALRSVGFPLGYHSCGLSEAAGHYSEFGSLADCESVEAEDAAALELACEADDPRLPFGERIAVEADWYRSQHTPDGRFLAAELDELARQARELYADDPETFVDRREALNRESPQCDRDDLVGLSYADVVL
jgi:hypothetical protein